MSLVLTDLVMPDKEGIELITDLRRMHPGLKIIAMSGGGRNSPHAYLNLASRLGAASVLAKPFSFQELMDAIKGALAKP
jgi:DNA-binding NtrC family response regulator